MYVHNNSVNVLLVVVLISLTLTCSVSYTMQHILDCSMHAHSNILMLHFYIDLCKSISWFFCV